MIDLKKEHEAFNAEFKKIGREYSSDLNSVGFNGILSANELGWLACAESKQAEIDSLKAQLSRYSKAALDVLGERNRQINQENYSIEHDDFYQNNELPRAAASYVNNVVSRGWVFNSVYGSEVYQSEEVPDLWPWGDEHWKPKNPRRDLVKAAALIIAEIDRMDRNNTGAKQ